MYVHVLYVRQRHRDLHVPCVTETHIKYKTNEIPLQKSASYRCCDQPIGHVGYTSNPIFLTKSQEESLRSICML